MEEDMSSGDEERDDNCEDGGAETMHTYMSELDEQLEGVLDADSRADGGHGEKSLPLSSHHVKVHGAEPLELDLHAMEHLLASFCSEQDMDPGPASLLLRELGLTSGSSKAIRRKDTFVASLQSLDSMD